MRTIIEQYNHKDITKIKDFVIEYRNTLDYRNIFTCKEWLFSYLEIYKPENNFLIRSSDNGNYFSLSVINNELIFTGDPFNDFNSAFTKNMVDLYDVPKIVNYFLRMNYQVKWNNLFEEPFIGGLKRIGQICDGTTCLKIDADLGVRNYDILVSNRIRRMYERFADNLSFHRIFGDKIKTFPQFLNNLLKMRQNKLLSRKKDEYNPSFDDKFNKFINRLTKFDSLNRNLFIDYCTNKSTGEVVSLSLNFVKDNRIICYLRGHAQSRNDISYGLILDYWSNKRNLELGAKIIDFTRGDESYKYRLGAREYKLKNFATI